MGWENDLNVAGCYLPSRQTSVELVNAAGSLTYDTAKGILDVTVLPELLVAGTLLDGVLLASNSAINNFYDIAKSSEILKIVGKVLLGFLCLMAFVAAAA